MKFKKCSKIKVLGLAGAVLLMSLNIKSSVPYYNYNWFSLEYSEIPKNIHTAAEIEAWVWGSNKNIQYKEHDGKCPFPQATLEKGFGDCKQKGALALALYYIICGKKGRLIIGEVKTKNSKKEYEINEPEKLYHVEVDYCGQTYYDESWFKPIKIYEFDEMAYFPFFYEDKVGVAELK